MCVCVWCMQFQTHRKKNRHGLDSHIPNPVQLHYFCDRDHSYTSQIFMHFSTLDKCSVQTVCCSLAILYQTRILAPEISFIVITNLHLRLRTYIVNVSLDWEFPVIIRANVTGKASVFFGYFSFVANLSVWCIMHLVIIHWCQYDIVLCMTKSEQGWNCFE